jgi:hypothetical protein
MARPKTATANGIALEAITVLPRTPAPGSARTSGFLLPRTPRTAGGQVFPRTPRTARAPPEYAPVDDEADDEADALLDGAEDMGVEREARAPPGELGWADRRGMALLTLLCACALVSGWGCS